VILRFNFIHLLLANLLIFLLISAGSFAQAETVNYASLSAGLDNDSGNQYDAYVDVALISDLRLVLGTGEYTSNSGNNNFTTRQNQIALAGHHLHDDLSAISWSLGYQTWGKKDAIESQDTVFSAGYFFKNNWHLSVDYETGKLELFIRPGSRLDLTSLSSKRKAWRFTTGYSHSTGSVWASFLTRKYEKNLPSLQRPVLQRAINGIALSQAYALSKEELTLGYEWLFETLDLGVDYNRIISVVDNHKNQYASIYTRHYIGQNLMINLRLEQEVNDSFTVFTAGIGIVW